MQSTNVWSDIDRKTKSRLKGARMRGEGTWKLLSRSSNMLFSLVTVALMTTVVHRVYQSSTSTPLEVRIAIGSALDDNEVPAVAEARLMRRVALERVTRMESDKAIGNYAERFDIDWDLAQLVCSISQSEGMDPNLIFNLIKVESKFNPNAVGKVGEIGLMQVRPETALTIDPGATQEKLFDPAYNIRIGIKHLKDHLHFYRGDLRLALLAYNRGRSTINTLLLMGENPSNGYAARVMKYSM